MGNYMRAVRELPKMRQQLQEVTGKRLEAERQLKLLKDDLAKNAAFVEKKREEAILGSADAVNKLQEKMDKELKEVREEGDLQKLLAQADMDDEVTKRAIRTRSRKGKE